MIVHSFSSCSFSAASSWLSRTDTPVKCATTISTFRQSLNGSLTLRGNRPKYGGGSPRRHCNNPNEFQVHSPTAVFVLVLLLLLCTSAIQQYCYMRVWVHVNHGRISYSSTISLTIIFMNVLTLILSKYIFSDHPITQCLHRPFNHIKPNNLILMGVRTFRPPNSASRHPRTLAPSLSYVS